MQNSVEEFYEILRTKALGRQTIFLLRLVLNYRYPSFHAKSTASLVNHLVPNAQTTSNLFRGINQQIHHDLKRIPVNAGKKQITLHRSGVGQLVVYV